MSFVASFSADMQDLMDEQGEETFGLFESVTHKRAKLTVSKHFQAGLPD